MLQVTAAPVWPEDVYVSIDVCVRDPVWTEGAERRRRHQRIRIFDGEVNVRFLIKLMALKPGERMDPI